MKQRWLPAFDYPDVDAPQSDLHNAGVVAEERAAIVPAVPGVRSVNYDSR